MADGAKDRMREEMGPEFDEVDWKKLDPRQYDPRRIIREALVDDGGAGPPRPEAGDAGHAQPYIESAYEQRQRKLGKGRPATRSTRSRPRRLQPRTASGDASPSRCGAGGASGPPSSTTPVRWSGG